MNWFYESAGQQQGPVNDEELSRLLAEGKVRPETLVWREGMGDWQPVSQARGGGAPPLPGADLASGHVRCASCGQSFPPAEMVQLGGRAICPACKPAVLATLQQGGALPSFGEDGRTGPAWEQRETLGVWAAIWQTLSAALTEPSRTFQNMKRQGGLGRPFIYFMITATAGLLVGYIYQGLMQGTLQTIIGSQPGLSPEFRKVFASSTLQVVVLCFASPFIAAATCFIGAGILHVCLMICQGARFPFETTFRVYCYAYGSATALQVIPACGSLAAMVWGFVAVCIGLARAHEISTGKAVLAVFLPLIVCCGLLIIFGVVAATLAGTAANHAG